MTEPNKGDLAGLTVYFAQPIDLHRVNLEKARLIDDAMDSLRDAGAVVFNPAAAFQVPVDIEPHDYVQKLNREALWRADAVVACFPEHSVGVPMEIQLADTLGKPLAILSGVWKKSWALAGVDRAIRVGETGFLHWTEILGNQVRTKGLEEPTDDQLRYVGPEELAPTRGYADDAGFDLRVPEHTTIPAGHVKDVPCGVNLEFPEGVWGLVIGRSSTIRTHHLTVNASVIDGGYRGPMFVAVHNTGDRCFSAEPGMRLAQIIPLPNTAEMLEVARVDQLSPGSRGDKGFGSTGR